MQEHDVCSDSYGNSQLPQNQKLIETKIINNST